MISHAQKSLQPIFIGFVWVIVASGYQSKQAIFLLW